MEFVLALEVAKPQAAAPGRKRLRRAASGCAGPQAAAPGRKRLRRAASG